MYGKPILQIALSFIRLIRFYRFLLKQFLIMHLLAQGLPLIHGVIVHRLKTNGKTALWQHL